MSDKSQQAFLADVQHHQMTVLRDDGLYRHLRFWRPGSLAMHFDLMTYPGGMLYRGDMGAFVFERLEDMFEFFRADGGRINPGYWAGKLVAIDRDGRNSSVREFDEEAFDRDIKREVLDWCRANAYRTTKVERRDLWDAVVDGVIDAGSDRGGDRKRIAATDFSHAIGGTNFTFDDVWQMQCQRYTHRFLWCCYALVWGIQQYDKFKAQEEQKEAIA